MRSLPRYSPLQIRLSTIEMITYILFALIIGLVAAVVVAFFFPNTNKKIQNLQNQITNLNSEITNLTIENNNLQNEVTNLTTEIIILNSEITNLTNEVIILNSEITNLTNIVIILQNTVNNIIVDLNSTCNFQACPDGIMSNRYIDSFLLTSLPVLQYSDSNITTVTNTSDETSLLSGSFIGSLTVLSSKLLVGTVISFSASGFYSSSLINSNVTLEFSLSSTSLLQTDNVLLPSNQVNEGWSMEGDCKISSVGLSGMLWCQGLVIFEITDSLYPSTHKITNLQPTTLNTLINQVIDFTVDYSIANSGNSLTLTNCYIVIYN